MKNKEDTLLKRKVVNMMQRFNLLRGILLQQILDILAC